MKKSFKFSIVIAIYNMENYLVDAIDSLLNQTIGFEDNLQVLFVNDGSTDNSEAICLEYTKQYPDNIHYIYKENGGVSSARNKGLEFVTGELINFLDADDKLAEDALEKVYDFYTQHKEEVDLISIPLHFFEGEEGEHLLNYKFESSRVIDIFMEPKCFQMHISSSFIKISAIKKYSFETNLKFGEDAQVANKVILDKGKYGVVADTRYLYRKRNTGASVIQGARTNKNNYIPPLKYLHLGLIEFAEERYPSIPEYLQRMLVYDLGWKIRVPFIDSFALNQKEIEEFLEYVKQILSFIDDEIILTGFNTQRFYSLYLLQLKYQKLPLSELVLISNKEDALLCYKASIVDMLYKQVVNVNNIEIKDHIIKLSGSFQSLFRLFELKLIMEINGVEKEITLHKNEKYQVTSLNKKIFDGYDFTEEIPVVGNETVIKIKAKIKDAKTQIKLSFKRNETDKKDTVLERNVSDVYKIDYKNKALTIKREVAINKEEGKNKGRDLISLNNWISTHKLHMKKLVLKCYAQGKQVRSKLNQRNKGDLLIATTYNQACMYDNDHFLLGKLTDSVISIDNFRLNQSILELSGTIVSSFQSDSFTVSCLSNGKKLGCKQKDKKFHVQIPLFDKNEIHFCINIREANVVTQLKLDSRILEDAVKQSGYKVKIEDKQKILVFY